MVSYQVYWMLSISLTHWLNNFDKDEKYQVSRPPGSEQKI